jgi:hypothetical protein
LKLKKSILLALIIFFSCTKDEPSNFFLSVIANTGGTVSIVGGKYESEGKYVSVGEEYAAGKIVSIKATPDNEYRFVKWSDGSIQNPLNITLNSDVMINASFQKAKYNLILTSLGKGTIKEELISSGKGSDPRYNSGSLVKLTAAPDYGYKFTKWSGDLTSSDNPVEVNVNSAKTILAVFELITVNLQINVQGEGEVLEETLEVISPENTNYNYGDTVRLTAQAAEGFDFISWSGDHVGQENPLEITLTESKTIQANFDFELFNRGVGKWKVRKKTSNKPPLWDIHSFILRRNYTYTVNSNSGQTNGNFEVRSNTEIELLGYGTISEAALTPSEDNSISTWGNFNFNLSIPGQFEGAIESEVDENYATEIAETGEILDKTYIPDDNFEQTLINLGYDDVIDDYVDTSSISSVQQLNNSEWAGTIYDLTGVEDFISLTSLQADNMEVSQLDISNNIYIENLSIHSNNLT